MVREDKKMTTEQEIKKEKIPIVECTHQGKKLITCGNCGETLMFLGTAVEVAKEKERQKILAEIDKEIDGIKRELKKWEKEIKPNEQIKTYQTTIMAEFRAKIKALEKLKEVLGKWQ